MLLKYNTPGPRNGFCLSKKWQIAASLKHPSTFRSSRVKAGIKIRIVASIAMYCGTQRIFMNLSSNENFQSYDDFHERRKA